MTTHISLKRVLFAAAICLVTVASFLALSSRGSKSPQTTVKQDQNKPDALAVRDALRRGGLREAAKLKGNYVADYNPHWDWGRFDIESLTKNSVAVVVGRFTKKLDARLIEGETIFTDYEVAVDEIVKGNLKQARTIVVTLPGGRFYFEEGTSAEQLTPTFNPARIGRAYTLFLMQEAAVPSVFFLSGGPQGMFDIGDSSTVRSHGRADDPATVETKSQSRDLFLKNIRQFALKWPNPGKCCG